MKVNLTTDFPPNLMRREAIELGLLKTREINLPGRSLLMTLTLSSSRSAVRSANKTSPNLRLDAPQGEDQPQDLTSDVFVYGRPNPDGSDNTPPLSIINFDDLLGRTFLLPMDENGERKRATISEHAKDLYQQQVSREDHLRFKLKIDGDQLEDLISYNQLMEYLEDKTDTGHWKMDFTDSHASKTIKDDILPQTQNTMEVATAYLLSGRLWSKHGNH